MDTKHLGINSKLIHAGSMDDPYGSATVPIYQTSTFAFHDAQNGADRFAGQADGFIYTRLGNPTIDALERQVAELENGLRGHRHEFRHGRGRHACTWRCSRQGAHIVGTASVYGPSRGLIEKHLTRFGVDSTYVDTSNLEQVQCAIEPNTRLVYIETPSNPAMIVTDIRAIAEIAHARGCLVVVDNTFASPYLQRPLDLGADVVLHSVTKFINGHADVVGGIVVAKTEALYKSLRPLMIALGLQHGSAPGVSGACAG